MEDQLFRVQSFIPSEDPHRQTQVLACIVVLTRELGFQECGRCVEGILDIVRDIFSESFTP